jgi:hypothetical protein
VVFSIIHRKYLAPTPGPSFGEANVST